MVHMDLNCHLFVNKVSGGIAIEAVVVRFFTFCLGLIRIRMSFLHFCEKVHKIMKVLCYFVQA